MRVETEDHRALVSLCARSLHLTAVVFVDLVAVSWHGAVIDTELDTEDTKAGRNEEDSLSNQEVKLAKGSGSCSCSRLEWVT